LNRDFVYDTLELSMKQTKKKEILICDDDPSVVSIFEFILGQSNFHVHAAKEYQESLGILKKHPSIRVMLLQLNDITKDSLKQLDNILKFYPLLPVLAIVNKRFDSAISLCYQHGAYGIIHKPFDIEEVVSIINEVITDHLP